MQNSSPAGSQGWVVRFRVAESSLLWLLFAAIGLLQMKRIHAGVITDYGADVVCPALLFVLTRQGKTILRHIGMRADRPVTIALGVFGLSAAWEFAQRYGRIPGVFDPLDLVAYAIGVIIPFLVDRWLSGRDRLASA